MHVMPCRQISADPGEIPGITHHLVVQGDTHVVVRLLTLNCLAFSFLSKFSRLWCPAVDYHG